METRKYSKRISSEDTLKLISARISLDSLFTRRKYNRNEAWRKVAAEAGVKADPEVLRKKWTNLLLKYKKLVEPKTDGRVEDGEDTATSWEYFDALHEWAGKRLNIIRPLSASNERGIIYLDTSSCQRNQVKKPQKETYVATPAPTSEGTDIEITEDIDLFLETIIEEPQMPVDGAATTKGPRAAKKRRHSESDFSLLPILEADAKMRNQVLESIDSKLEKMVTNQRHTNNILTRLVNSAETLAKTQASIANSLGMIAKKLSEI